MFSKQPTKHPVITFDLWHLPQKRRKGIELRFTLGELEHDAKLTGCEVSCGGGPGFIIRPHAYHIEQALNQYYSHLGGKAYLSVGGIRVIVDNPSANVDLPDTAAQDSDSKSNSPAVSG